MKFIGIEIGGTKLQVVVGTPDGRILIRRRSTVDSTLGADGIRRQISQILRELIDSQKPVGIGVGFGGPVDWKTGRIQCSHQVKGWHDFDLGQWLQTETRLPVRVDNDANVAALGEAHSGNGRGYRVVFYMTLGSGVGGGLVIENRIYHGACPGEVEIGHVRLNRSGTLVENRCSGWAIDRRIRAQARRNSKSWLAKQVLRRSTPGGEAKHLAAALKKMDPMATQILSELGDDLGFALSHVVNLFHPDVIVIGGGLSMVGKPLREVLAKSLPRWIMDSFQPGPKIHLAGLKENSVPVGALLLGASTIS